MAKKTNKVPRDIIYIIIIAVLVIALLVVLFAGNKIGDILGGIGGENDVPPASNGKTSVMSTLGRVVLPSEFDKNDCLEVHFIDIGQGDAIAIKFPDGKNMLIDAGSGTSVSAATRTKYMSYLSDVVGLAENDTVDYLIVTHPDSDHVNMMSDVLKKYDVDNIYYNDYSYKTQSKVYSAFSENAVAEPGAVVNAVGATSESYKIEGEGYTMDIYAPGYETFREEAYEGTNKNILSIMCVLSYGGRKVMFTGDAEVPTEQWFMNTVGGDSLDVDILKVGHHGSYSCTSTGFLDFIKPEYAVISCDNGQAYHHPHPETMNTLFNYGVVTYRTNRHGSTVLYIADDGDFGFLPEKNVETENNTKNRNPMTITLS